MSQKVFISILFLLLPVGAVLLALMSGSVANMH